MTVTRETKLDIAHAEMNDEYGVDLTLLGRSAALTAAEAVEIAGELVQAAYEALSAAQQDVARPVDLQGFDIDQAAAILRGVEAFGGAE